MLALPLLVVLASAPAPVELQTPEHLELLPRGELAAHLRAVNTELRALRHEPTGWMVFQSATEKATPFVLVTAIPVGVLGFIAGETNARLPDEVWLVAGGALGIGVLTALFYAVGQVMEHALISGPAHAARLQKLEGYRPVVLEALARMPKPEPAPAPSL